MKIQTIINLFSFRKSLYAKVCLFLIASSMLALQSCGENNSQIPGVGDGEEPIEHTGASMILKADATASDLMDNAKLYLFSTANEFVGQKALTREGIDKLKAAKMAEGTWNMVLLAADKDISANITTPSGTMATSLMWKTPLTTAGDFLQPTPELHYAPISAVVIQRDETTNASATLRRNVAKVKINLISFVGCDVVDAINNVNAWVELYNVPTSLNWTGNLALKSDNTPIRSEKPVRQQFTFNYATQQADPLEFYIPANLGAALADKVENKLRLKMSMPVNGNESVKPRKQTETILIDAVFKANEIITVNIREFKGEPQTGLDIWITVEEWKDVNQEVDFP